MDVRQSEEQTKANAQTKVAKAQAEAVVMQKKATGELIGT